MFLVTSLIQLLTGTCDMRVRKRFLDITAIVLAVPLFVLSLAGAVRGQDSDIQPLSFGHATSVYSRVLGEDRTILVDLPTGYEYTQTRYPVLFLLDGMAHFHHAAATADFLSRTGRIPQMIVVGITNTARTRDLTPTHVADSETSGGADTFIKFIEDELIPFVDERYRTQPCRVLFGHSLAGMFSVYTLFTKPQLFAGYVAASPHLQWDDGRVVDLAEEILNGRPSLKSSLYISLGDEPDYAESVDRFTRLLEKADDSGLRWEYVVLEEDDHMSTPLKSNYEGLEMVFSAWRFPGDLSEAEVSAVQAHYQKLSGELGYEILIPEGLLNQLGYILLSQERYDVAVAAF